MNLNTALIGISKQLDLLENVKPETPAEAENALNDLQKISAELLQVLRSHGDDIELGEMLGQQLILNRINKLNDVFIKQCPIGVSLDKIKKIARNTQG